MIHCEDEKWKDSNHMRAIKTELTGNKSWRNNGFILCLWGEKKLNPFHRSVVRTWLQIQYGAHKVVIIDHLHRLDSQIPFEGRASSYKNWMHIWIRVVVTMRSWKKEIAWAIFINQGRGEQLASKEIFHRENYETGSGSRLKFEIGELMFLINEVSQLIVYM